MNFFEWFLFLSDFKKIVEMAMFFFLLEKIVIIVSHLMVFLFVCLEQLNSPR